MGWWTELRDTVEAAGVVAGNYFLPGSSLVTSQLVSDGAKEKLNSDLGRLATLGSGGYGAYEGNLANWTGGTGTGAETSGSIAEGTDSANKTKTLADITANGGQTTQVGAPGSLSQGSNFSTELPNGYQPGVVNSTVANAGPTTTLASNSQNIGSSGLEGNAGQGIQASGFGTQTMGSGGNGTGLGATASTTSVPGGQLGWSTSPEVGMGAPTEGYFSGGIPGAPTDPSFLSSMMAGNYGNALESMGKGAWDTISNNKLATAMVGSSLYDMYAKKQMAKKQEDMYNQNRADINGMFAAGSPEALAMQQEMARKDAAAGRNSQYGVRQADYLGNVAKFKLNALGQAANAQSGLAAAQLGNQYGGLNSMFNNLAMYSLLNKSTR